DRAAQVEAPIVRADHDGDGGIRRPAGVYRSGVQPFVSGQASEGNEADTRPELAMAQQVQRVVQVVCGIPDASEGRRFTTGKRGPQPRARLGKLAQVSAVQLASQLARHLSIRSVARLEQPSIHDLEAVEMEKDQWLAIHRARRSVKDQRIVHPVPRSEAGPLVLHNSDTGPR